MYSHMKTLKLDKLYTGMRILRMKGKDEFSLLEHIPRSDERVSHALARSDHSPFSISSMNEDEGAEVLVCLDLPPCFGREFVEGEGVMDLTWYGVRSINHFFGRQNLLCM